LGEGKKKWDLAINLWGREPERVRKDLNTIFGKIDQRDLAASTKWGSSFGESQKLKQQQNAEAGGLCLEGGRRGRKSVPSPRGKLKNGSTRKEHNNVSGK